MRHLAVFIALVALVAPPVMAETKTGNTNPNKLVTYEVVPLFGGTLNATLTWSKRNASLFVVMVCSDGFDTIPWGASASFEDRVQHLHTGVMPLLVCEYGITSFSGNSKFAFNVQEASDAFPSASSGRRTFQIRKKSSPSPALRELAARVKTAR